ncbi:flavin reductase family protein [Thermoproteota archaeon]
MFEEVNPRQVICVTSRAEVDVLGQRQVKDNIFTLAWHCPLSFDPLLYGICVGKGRYSLDLIRKGKVFVVNFMPHERLDDVLFCGRNSGAHVDKFEKTDLVKEEAETIDCSRIKEALGYLECEIFSEYDIGDHILIIGKVLKAHSAKGPRLFYLGNNEFSTTIKP